MPDHDAAGWVLCTRSCFSSDSALLTGTRSNFIQGAEAQPEVVSNTELSCVGGCAEITDRADGRAWCGAGRIRNQGSSPRQLQRHVGHPRRTNKTPCLRRRLHSLFFSLPPPSLSSLGKDVSFFTAPPSVRRGIKPRGTEIIVPPAVLSLHSLSLLLLFGTLGREPDGRTPLSKAYGLLLGPRRVDFLSPFPRYAVSGFPSFRLPPVSIWFLSVSEGPPDGDLLFFGVFALPELAFPLPFSEMAAAG